MHCFGSGFGPGFVLVRRIQYRIKDRPDDIMTREEKKKFRILYPDDLDVSYGGLELGNPPGRKGSNFFLVEITSLHYSN